MGVKQGGPMSPRLYSFYCDAMLTELLETNSKIFIGKTILNAIMYADDTLVIAESRESLVILINIVMSYCKRWQIKLNVEKSQYMKFDAIGRKGTNDDLIVNGTKLKKEKSIKYLGVIISEDLTGNDHIKDRILKTIRALYSLNPTKITSKTMNYAIKLFMIKAYCDPSLFYGIENITVSRKHLKDLHSCTGQMIKRVLSLSKRCRHTDLMLADNMLPTKTKIKRIKLSFFVRLTENETTREILEEINTTSDIVFSNSRKKSLITEIYEICEQKVRVDLKALRQIVLIELVKISNEHKDQTSEAWIETIKYMLEEDQLAQLEILLKPESLLEWEMVEEEEINMRVEALNEIYNEMIREPDFIL